MQAMIKDIMRTCAISSGALLAVALHLTCHGYAPSREARLLNLNMPDSDSIVLQSSDSYCLGGDPILTVTGKNVTWYADAAKTTMLFRGNSYWAPPLFENTTYYLTQTIDGVESPVQPISIEIIELFLEHVATTPASCGKTDGTMTVTARGATARHPLLYKLDENPFQLSPVFNHLPGDTYMLTIKAPNCWGSIDIKVDQQPSPVIATIDSVVPHCGSPDGSLRIGAYGGTGSLSYSLNGTDFQTSNWFEGLEGGSYTLSVRDDSLCITSQPVYLNKTIPLRLNTIDIVPSTCGKPNGQVIISAAEGNGTLIYSLAGRPNQASDTFADLAVGTYLVSAKDERGCKDEQTVEVTEHPQGGDCGSAFYLPTAFTPNRDGVNDGWAAFFSATSLQLEELTLYDRWGEVILHQNARSIQSGQVLWDGTYQGSVLSGLFTYQLKVQFDNGQGRVYSGTVTALQ
jgi:gliding motility-associated-like protein